MAYFLDKKHLNEDGLVWNFAFGANMNDNTFIKMRGIKPVKSIACKAKNW